MRTPKVVTTTREKYGRLLRNSNKLWYQDPGLFPLLLVPAAPSPAVPDDMLSTAQWNAGVRADCDPIRALRVHQLRAHTP